VSEIPVTEHFTIAEFACHDGAPYPISQIDDEDDQHRSWFGSRLLPLCQMLEVIREAGGGVPITIDSGYRTLEYDERLYEASAKDGDVAPASRSQHPKGRAADITHPTLGPVALFNLICGLYERGLLRQLGGVGLYPSFVHVDVRVKVNGHLAIWGAARPSNIL
jgi:uncharacterized protein YcbK (DUF882 family)